MKMKANIVLALPQSSISGTKINSKIFIVAIPKTCTMALNPDLRSLKIHTAIKISKQPMIIVNDGAFSDPRIFATISSCLGTRFKTLQNNPLAIQMAAIPMVSNL